MIRFKKNEFETSLRYLWGGALVLPHIYCLKYLGGFHFVGEEGIRWLGLFTSFVPLLFIFLVLSSFLPAGLAALQTGVIELVLNYINFSKQRITNEPLVWSDLSTLLSNNVASRYLTSFHHFTVIAILAFFLWTLWFVKNYLRRGTLHQGAMIGSLFLLPVLCFPCSSFLGNSYRSVDWSENLRMNGLLLHLLQTSVPAKKLRYTAQEQSAFLHLKLDFPENIRRPDKIVFILCESCWNDEKHFQNIFKPLLQRDFHAFRSISPVYGGGTPNAAFEILTGLPAINSHLTGILYQEYVSSFGDLIYAVPNQLRAKNYNTFAFHNNHRTFWNRHIMNKKLGFQQFVSIEDMTQPKSKTSEYWSDDSTLFESALIKIRTSKESRLFTFLSTIYTHGPYQHRNDFGESHYQEKMQVSIAALTTFIDGVLKTDPDTLIFIFGDNKPALGQYFLNEKLIKQSDLNAKINWEKIGDVPVLIRHPDTKRVLRVIESANHLPFFCTAAAIDREFIQSGLPAFAFSRQNKLCENFHQRGYPFYKDAFPEWLYALSLFGDEIKWDGGIGLKTSIGTNIVKD